MLTRVLHEWVLKRMYRFVLKPFLSRILQTELDLDQLDVQFLDGTIELRSLALNTDFVSQHLEKFGWKLTEGLIGQIKVEIPYYALSSSQIAVTVSDIDMRVEPCECCTEDCPGAQVDLDTQAADGYGSDEEGLSSEDESNYKGVIANSIEMIAGSLETFLQKLKITCTNATVQAAFGDSEKNIVLSVRNVCYETRVPGEEGEEEPSTPLDCAEGICREVSFDGLYIIFSNDSGSSSSFRSLPSEEEFLDARSTDSCSTAGSPSTGAGAVPLLEGQGGKGLAGLVRLSTAHEGSLREEPYSVISVELDASVVHVNEEALSSCARLSQYFLADAPDEATQRVDERVHDEDLSEGGQRDIIGSVLFPDCRSIAADMLPALFANSCKSTDDEGPQAVEPCEASCSRALAQTPPEASQLAQSMEEFFDANSVMKLSETLSGMRPHQVPRVHREDLQEIEEESSVDSMDSGSREKVMRFELDIEGVCLDAQFCCAVGSSSSQGLQIQVEGLVLSHNLFQGGADANLQVVRFGVTAYGYRDPKLSLEMQKILESAPLPPHCPPSSGTEAAFFSQKNTSGEVVLVTSKLHPSGTNWADISLSQNNKTTTATGTLRTAVNIKAEVGPVWCMLHADVLVWVHPKVAALCGDLQMPRNAVKEDSESSGPRESNKSSTSLHLDLDCCHLRILLGVGSVGNSFLVVDIMQQHPVQDEHLLKASFESDYTLELRLMEVILWSIEGADKPLDFERVLHIFKSQVSGAALQLMLRGRKVQRSSLDDKAFSDSTWNQVSSRFFETDEMDQAKVEIRSGDEHLEDFYLQEKAISQADLFLHLKWREVSVVVDGMSIKPLARFIHAFAFQEREPDSDSKAAKPKKAAKDGLTLTLLSELSLTVKCYVHPPSENADRDRFFVAKLSQTKICLSHSSTFSMGYVNAKDLSVSYINNSEGTEILRVSPGTSFPALLLSSVLKQDVQSLENRALVGVCIGNISILVPHILTQQEDLIEEVCSILNEPAAPNSQLFVKVSAQFPSVFVGVEFPSTLAVGDPASLLRKLELSCSGSVFLDTEQRKGQVGLRSTCIVIQYPSGILRSCTVLDASGLLVKLTALANGHQRCDVVQESLHLRANEDAIIGLAQFIQYTAQYLQRKESASRGSASCATREIDKYRRLKMERMRIESDYVKSNSNWVVLDESLCTASREDAHDGVLISKLDEEIEGHSHVFAASSSVSIIEDYIRVPTSDEDESIIHDHSTLFPKGHLQQLQGEYSWPLSKLHVTLKVKRIHLCLETMCSLETTPSSSVSPQVDADLEQSNFFQLLLMLQRTEVQFSMSGDQDSSRSWHLGVAVKNIEADEKHQGKTSHILYLWETIQRPLEDKSLAILCDVSWDCPDSTCPAEDEMSVKLSVLPLRLRLNQNVVYLLSDLSSTMREAFASKEDDRCDVEADMDLLEADSELARKEDVYVKRCEVSSLLVRLDYVPQRPKVASAIQGKMMVIEMLNLVPLHGVELNMKQILLSDVYGFSECSENIVGEWLGHIAKYQAGKFVVGIKPLKSFYKVGAGARKLFALPLEEYQQQDGNVARGLKKGVGEFVHAVSLEVLQLGAHIAGFSENLLLQTSSSSSDVSQQPADIRQGLQQASDRLSSGIHAAASLVSEKWRPETHETLADMAVDVLRVVPAAVVGPASAAAGAIRCTLTGVRNSLDPERYHNQKKDRY